MTNQNTGATERRGPPMPKFMFKVMNPLMKAMLNSPLHGRVSKKLMVLTFTGRKTGKRYSTPVGYVRQGNDIYVITHTSWWKNLRGGMAVTMRIQGLDVAGMARVVDDPEGIKSMVRVFLAARDEKMARQLGYWTDDVDAPAEKITADVKGTHFILITVTDQAK
jgi:deazaflavin-dependent oxidoreductase (nitroreductase family)